MKRYLYSFILTLVLTHAFSHEPIKGNYKEELTLKDTFFGAEDNYMVCYPKGHRDLFLIIFISTGIATFLFYTTIRQKIRGNRVLKHTNEEISQKNHEILESIRYAKRIQEAILPKSSYLKSVSESLEFLYKPKDIVSGDFYWVHKNENGLFIAVIDCTGHGVPGAFLSLLAHDAINHAVIEKKLSIPTDILSSMNVYIKEALNQHHINDSQDSMEVGLCRINGNEVKYAGAGIKLKYYSQQKLHEIKAAKCSIGSVQDKSIQLPINHTLTLNAGDKLYMHSDGLPDQFGGTDNKKLTAKKLNQFIESVAHKDIVTQKRDIEHYFENWKGKTEQTDDVLLAMYTI